MLFLVLEILNTRLKRNTFCGKPRGVKLHEARLRVRGDCVICRQNHGLSNCANSETKRVVQVDQLELGDPNIQGSTLGLVLT